MACTARTLAEGEHKLLEGSLARTVERIRAAGGEALAIPCDVSEYENCERAVQEVRRAFGPLDVLVNNAALTYFIPIADYPLSKWHRSLAVNFHAPFYLAKLALEDMLPRRSGAIVNISSGAAIGPGRGPYSVEVQNFLRGATLYGAEKAALERFTQGLAAEVFAQGISVTCVSPSQVVATPGAVHHHLVKDEHDPRGEPVAYMARAALLAGHRAVREDHGPRDVQPGAARRVRRARARAGHRRRTRWLGLLEDLKEHRVMRLRDRVAIITGGGSGIGTAYCRRFLAEGAKVMIADIGEAQAKRTAESLAPEGAIDWVRTDVADEASAAECVAATLARFGRVDILLNNAAIYGDYQPTDTSLAYLRRMFDVNVHGQWLMARAVAPHFVKQRSGRIINVASIAAYLHQLGAFGDPENFSLGSYSYQHSKFSVIGLTRHMAGQPRPVRRHGELHRARARAHRSHAAPGAGADPADVRADVRDADEPRGRGHGRNGRVLRERRRAPRERPAALRGRWQRDARSSCTAATSATPCRRRAGASAARSAPEPPGFRSGGRSPSWR